MPAGSGVSGLVLADTTSRWGDLSLRVVSALVLLPVTLFCIWLGGYAFLLVVATGGLVLAYEWLAMCGLSPSNQAFFWFPIGIAAVAISSGLGQAGSGLLIVAAGTLVAALFPRRFCPLRPRDRTGRGASPDEPAPGNNATTAGTCSRFNLAFGIPYIGLAAVALPWLRADPTAGLANTLFVLSIVWASDIGAYVVGRLAGGPKLAPRISPGKTWSGAAGGLGSAALGGFAVASCLSADITSLRASVHMIGLGLVLGVISQAGDLLESAIKRHFGVKDSGRIIPGHGGLLDRLDALLVAAPVAALLAFSVGRGVVLWQ
jgi:phosphatidate cytidylyltransferase